jgi:hemoglobin
VTGGPQVYTGRSMKDAHHHLHITEVEWDAMVSDFVATLDRFNVPKPEQQELLTIVATTKGDIVTSPAAAR